MVVEDLRMDISICNYLCEMTKVKRFTLGALVSNDEDNNKYLIVGVTFKKIENYPRFVYVLLSYANLFHGIKKEGNK